MESILTAAAHHKTESTWLGELSENSTGDCGKSTPTSGLVIRWMDPEEDQTYRCRPHLPWQWTAYTSFFSKAVQEHTNTHHQTDRQLLPQSYEIHLNSICNFLHIFILHTCTYEYCAFKCFIVLVVCIYVCIYIDIKRNFVICEHIKAVKDSFSSYYYYCLHTYEVMYMEGLQLGYKFS